MKFLIDTAPSAVVSLREDEGDVCLYINDIKVAFFDDGDGTFNAVSLQDLEIKNLVSCGVAIHCGHMKVVY